MVRQARLSHNSAMNQNTSSLPTPIVETFRALLAAAEAIGEPEPTAMTLATAQADGRVSARVVLLKAIEPRGLMFVTNYDSLKGRQIADHPQAALCVLWKKPQDGVQVRIEGIVERASAAESDGYFASRPRASQIGAWASQQSETLSARAVLEARIAQYEVEFASRDVPRPPFWGGYWLKPDLVEFWYGARHRLHERVRHECVDGKWTQRLLYP
jgi:pyridoxamine 5'-phosphate oxidase